MFKMEDPTTEDLDLITLPFDNVDFSIPALDYILADAGSDETLDLGTIVVQDFKQVPQIQNLPISPRGPPERTIETEKCNFAVEIDGSQTQKKKYLYSHILNRIYVDMNFNFSVNFTWDTSKVPQQDMFVRATVVFSDPEQAQKRVERCLQHAHVTSNATTTDAVIVNNVLRSAREMGDPNVHYCGKPEVVDSWYSVVVQLSKPDSHAYHFVCKNSCGSGINRRALDIIFTLEDSIGTVYGRQSVGARVCSCIRRDKKTQEEEFLKSSGKRALPPPAQPFSKKIKIEVVPNPENDVVTIPKMDIVGPRTAITSLQVAHSMMEQLRAANRAHHQPTDDLDKCIHAIKKIIDNLQSKYNIQ